MQTPRALGIIAGSGVYPLLLANAARKAGVNRIVAAAFHGETDPALAQQVDHIEWMRVGQLGRLISTFKSATVRDAIMACRNGGIVSIIGVYGGLVDKFPLGPMMNRGLTIRTGQCHEHRYMKPLLERIEKGEIDPSFVITHRMPLEDAAKGYKMFRNKQDNCEKIVLKPQQRQVH